MLLAVGKESPKCLTLTKHRENPSQTQLLQNLSDPHRDGCIHTYLSQGGAGGPSNQQKSVAVPRVMGKTDDLSSSERGTKT